MVLPSLLGKELHSFIHLLLDDFLLSLYYMHCAGCCIYRDEHRDLIPALIEFIVDQERMTLNNINCYSWAKCTKEEWMMKV